MSRQSSECNLFDIFFLYFVYLFYSNNSQGVPVLILANKQDLPGAREPKQLEKLLGLHELSPLSPQTALHISNCNASSNTTTTTTGSGGGGGGGPTISTTPGGGTSQQQQQNLHHSSPATPQQNAFKGWYIQPACAITGEGLQEGLEQLYDMIIKKRKMNKANKKKR